MWWLTIYHSSVIEAQVVLKLNILFSSGLWNLVFLFSNLSLVFLMPFAYFFTESEGFAGSKKVATMSNGNPQIKAEMYRSFVSELGGPVSSGCHGAGV